PELIPLMEPRLHEEGVEVLGWVGLHDDHRRGLAVDVRAGHDLDAVLLGDAGNLRTELEEKGSGLGIARRADLRGMDAQDDVVHVATPCGRVGRRQCRLSRVACQGGAAPGEPRRSFCAASPTIHQYGGWAGCTPSSDSPAPSRRLRHCASVRSAPPYTARACRSARPCGGGGGPAGSIISRSSTRAPGRIAARQEPSRRMHCSSSKQRSTVTMTYASAPAGTDSKASPPLHVMRSDAPASPMRLAVSTTTCGRS